MTMTRTTVRQRPAAEPPRLGRATPASLYLLARRLADRGELWGPHVRFARDARVAVRIARTESYEAWLLTWLPDQSTGLHDHGHSAGAFAVLTGALEERTLSVPRPGSPVRTPPALVSRTLPSGRVRAFGPDHVHDVANVATAPAASLHVYSPALLAMRRFVLDDSGELPFVADERSGEDW